ncbi:MAG TPA: CPBP family intramembrane glutamic endopeptidase, partial [Terriglobales bacterium]|nr:CPBP family intramembrane glutamic endopeptidase [Terriglobales bacterium]
MAAEPNMNPDQVSAAPPRPSAARVFLGPNGLRSGWKCLLFFACALLLIYLLVPLAFRVVPPPPRHGIPLPTTLVGAEVVEAVASLLMTAIMAWLVDKRPFGRFGIPKAGAFGPNFWIGALIGFSALTIQLELMHLGGWFSFGRIVLHGSDVLKYAALWGILFLCTGFFEESLLRGYPLRVLTDGMGFWPSAVLLSVLFAAAHLSNRGEDWFGIFMVFIDGMVMCFSLWRTGNLWFAIGNHAAWDWGQTFFFGTPDSGLPATHALLAPTFAGRPLLSGGS